MDCLDSNLKKSHLPKKLAFAEVYSLTSGYQVTLVYSRFVSILVFPVVQTKPIKSAKYALLVLQATVKICNLVFKSSNDKYRSGKESVI